MEKMKKQNKIKNFKPNIKKCRETSMKTKPNRVMFTFRKHSITFSHTQTEFRHVKHTLNGKTHAGFSYTRNSN